MVSEIDNFCSSSLALYFWKSTMPTFDPPGNFNFGQPTEWPECRRQFERFQIASKLEKDSRKVQVNSFILTMGAEADHAFGSFACADPSEDNDYEVVMQKLANISFYNGAVSKKRLSSTPGTRKREKQGKDSFAVSAN